MVGTGGKRTQTAPCGRRERGSAGRCHVARVTDAARTADARTTDADHALTPAECAALQGGVVTRAQLVAALGEAAVRRALRAGDWQLVRRGVYATRAAVDAGREDPRRQHRLECAAQVLLSDRELVVSHSSAAVLHRMTLLDGYAGPPQLTLPVAPGSPPHTVHGVLTAGLPVGDQEVVDGLVTTTRPRTVADLARTLGRPAAVVMADAALRAGVQRDAVAAALRSCTGWPGVRQAREVVACADARAESPLESLARLWFADAGLPPPDLQVRLCHGIDGRFVARVDFLWVQHRTVCEVDGRVKYEEQEDGLGRRPPRNPLWQEKLREDTMRDLGLEIARGYWSDGRDHGRSLVERVQRAFARGDQRTDRPSYGILTSR